MSRRRSREFALQALYQVEQNTLAAEPALAALGASRTEGDDMDAAGAELEELQYARALVTGVLDRSTEIDGLIDGASTNWRVRRMPLVDRNILRICTFELLACADVPHSVAINEAIELAKRFGDTDSKAFVNGILDRIAAETGRGGRRHKPS